MDEGSHSDNTENGNDLEVQNKDGQKRSLPGSDDRNYTLTKLN